MCTGVEKSQITSGKGILIQIITVRQYFEQSEKTALERCHDICRLPLTADAKHAPRRDTLYFTPTK